VAGKVAQDGVLPGQFPDPAPRTISSAVVASVAPTGTQVALSALGYDQTLASFKVAPKGGGVSGFQPCNSQVARAYAGY